MAQIPTYNGQQTFTSEAASVRSLGAERETPQDYSGLKRAKTNAFSRYNEIGNKLTDIGNKLQDAAEAEDLADARIDKAKAYAELERQMASPEFRETNKPEMYDDFYQNATKQINNAILKKYNSSSGRVVKRIDDELQEQTIRSGVVSNSLAMNHRVDIAEGEIINKAEWYKNAAAEAMANGKPDWYLNFRNDWIGYIEGKTSIIGADKVEQWKNAFEGDLNTKVLSSQIDADPVGTYNLFKEGKIKGLSAASHEIWKGKAKAAAIAENRMILADEDRQYRIDERDRVKRERDSSMAARIGFYNGLQSENDRVPGVPTLTMKEVLKLGSERKIPEATVKSLWSTSQRAETVKNNPWAVNEINEMIADNKPVDEINTRLRYYNDKGEINDNTVAILGKSAISEEDSRAKAIIQGTKPGINEKYDPMKHMGYSDRMEEYETRRAAGENPISLAQDISDKHFNQHSELIRRHLGIAVEADTYAQTNTLREKTLERFNAGGLTKGQYQTVLDSISALEGKIVPPAPQVEVKKFDYSKAFQGTSNIPQPEGIYNPQGDPLRDDVFSPETYKVPTKKKVEKQLTDFNKEKNQ